MTTLQKVTKGTNSCQFGVVPFSVARHSLIVFVPRLTSRDISSRSDFAFNPAVEGGRRSCGSPPKLRIRKRLSCGKRRRSAQNLARCEFFLRGCAPQDLILDQVL